MPVLITCHFLHLPGYTRARARTHTHTHTHTHSLEHIPRTLGQGKWGLSYLMSQTLQNLKIQAICSNYASRRALVTYIHKHVLSMDVSTTIMSMLATSTKPRRFMASGKLGALNFGSRLKQLWRKAPMALSSWGADHSGSEGGGAGCLCTFCAVDNCGFHMLGSAPPCALLEAQDTFAVYRKGCWWG
mmetsp:Transcript_13591/g.36359  ORF Transcript_13591/g.36359 Transcript_13591/m.36359 type:complete len:187 (+) Transcript_13591:350-910(+)